jgi:hypothetical protein
MGESYFCDPQTGRTTRCTFPPTFEGIVRVVCFPSQQRETALCGDLLESTAVRSHISDNSVTLFEDLEVLDISYLEDWRAAAQGWLQILSGGLQRAGATFRTPVDRESGRLNVPRDWLATRYSVVFSSSSSSMGMKAISSCFDIRLSPAMRRACGVRTRLLSTPYVIAIIAEAGELHTAMTP